MQTQIGRILSFVALMAAATLAWTGDLTHWFPREDPPRFLWIFGGLLVALGLVRLIDRRIWVLRARRARQARREAAQKATEAQRAAYKEWRQDFLQVLSEPVGDELIKAPEPQPMAQ